MKEVAKNQQFRVGFLTWFFVLQNPVKGYNGFMIFENWHPRVTPGSFDCLRAASWGFVYTTLTHSFLFFGKERFSQHCFCTQTGVGVKSEKKRNSPEIK